MHEQNIEQKQLSGHHQACETVHFGKFCAINMYKYILYMCTMHIFYERHGSDKVIL
jgi:hypothetical protein